MLYEVITSGVVVNAGSVENNFNKNTIFSFQLKDYIVDKSVIPEMREIFLEGFQLSVSSYNFV